MPKFQIEQYELHVMKYEITADSEADAIVKLLDGEAEPIDGSLEYVEIAKDFGLSVDEHRKLAKQVHALGVPVGEVIPSIRSIEEVA